MSHEPARPAAANLGLTHELDRQEIIQYNDGQLALRIEGEKGEVFDWTKHKYDPDGHPDNAAIVLTESGNGYYVKGGWNSPMRIVNIGESIRQGKLVAAERQDDSHGIPNVTFGESWEVPGFYTTSPVRTIFLKYKQTTPGTTHPGARKIDAEGKADPNPFDEYERFVAQLPK